jgi:Kef-type K+ transport system membrane component KefB
MELDDALSLVIFYAGAALMPLVASRIHIPAAVAEILYGLTISGLGIIHESQATDLLAELGFIYLMFLVGMEIDFNRIEREGTRSVFLAFFVAAAILGSAVVVARQLGMSMILALVLGAMSVGILLVALVDIGASQTRWGQIILLVGSVGEFFTLMSLTAWDLIATHGLGLELGFAVLEVLVLFLVAFVVLGLLRLVVWWFPHSFGRWVQEHDPSELGVRFGFVLMLSLAALAAWAELEPILGAFLAGMLFAYVFREIGVLETKLVALGQGFFVPLFFINVGVTFDWSAVGDLRSLGASLLVLSGASLLVKLVPCLLLLVIGLRIRSVLGGALLLATPLTLLVAIAALGVEMHMLDATESASVILLAIVTAVVFPTLFKLVAPKAGLSPGPDEGPRSMVRW